MPPTTTHPRWQRTVYIVSATQGAVLIGFSFAFPFLPLLIQDLGVTDRAELSLWTGIAIGFSGIAMAIFSPIWGLLADRFGRKAMLVRSVGSGAVLLAMQAAVQSVWQLVAVRVLQGVFTGTQTASAMLIAVITPKERTGFALGLLNTAAQLGNLAGPIIGGIAVTALGLRPSFVIGAVVIAICAVVVVIFAEDTAVVTRKTAEPNVARDILMPFGWPALRGVLVIGFLVQSITSGTFALIAIYVQDLARPEWLSLELAIGLSLALLALSAAIAMPVLGSWADRNDPRALLITSIALLGLSMIPQALIANLFVFLALRLVNGLAIAGVTSGIVVITRAGAPMGGEGRAFGALAAAQNFGWGVGPILGSAFAAVWGIPALFVAGAAVAIVLVPVALSPALFPVTRPRETATEVPLPLVTAATAED